MGSSFQGIDTWYNKMLQNLQMTRNKMNKQSKLFLFNLHKLYPKRCKSKDGPCYKCNDEIKQTLFRDAIRQIVSCIDGLEIYDTFSLTNTSFAEKDGSDAVHYHQTTTYNEMKVLLNMICPRRDGRIMKPTQIPIYNDLFIEQKSDCQNTNFDEVLAQYKPEETRGCIPEGWTASHKRN